MVAEVDFFGVSEEVDQFDIEHIVVSCHDFLHGFICLGGERYPVFVDLS